ncbi:MAG: SLC13 family permease, partial [Armatimonadetes bacterium]|nr:SLC13 family permease [Armatimonadota bacterium]
MTPAMVAVLVLTVVAIVLFITEWLPPDVVALSVMTILMASGILTAKQGFAGFSDASTITVASMFVLSAAVTRTGALNYFGALLGRLFRTRFRVAYLLLLLGVGLASGFLSNTAVVVIFLPVLLTACRDARISPSKVLIPLSYLSIAGGACTLIGTSTNIVVSSLLPRFGLEPVGMFEVTPVGLLLLIATVAFMYGPGSRLLPNGKTDSGLEQRYGIGRYLLDVTLRPGSRSAGKPLSESPLIGELGVDVFGIFRNGTSLGWPS